MQKCYCVFYIFELSVFQQWLIQVAKRIYAVFRWQNYKSTLDAAVGYTVSLLPIINSTLQLAVCLL